MFEGGSSSDNLDHLRKLFRDNKEEIRRLFPNFNLKDFLEINVVDPMSVDLKSLESFLIPSGWNGFPAGHVILLMFTKENEEFFTCRIFNTGEDAHIHGSILENGTKIKTPNALILKKIRKEKLDETFFRFLSLSKQEYLKGQTFYQALVDYLQADIAHDFSGSLINFRTPQRSGTCSWKCVMSFLRHLCGDYGTYRRVKHYIFGKKFEECYKYIDLLHTLPQSPEKTQYLNLLEKSAEKFARSIAKSFSQGFIQEEKKGYLDLILKIKKQIKQKEEKQRATPLRLDESSLTSQPSFSYPQSLDSIPVVFSIKGIDTTHFDMSTPAKILICIDQIIKIIDVSDNRYWAIEIISRLPLPQDSIWSQFSKEDKIKLAQALSTILVRFESRYEFIDRVLSAHYHLLAIVDRLRIESNESIFESAPLDVFDFSTYEYLNTFSLSKADIDYRQAVYEYYKHGKDEKREKKLFYFFTGQSRYSQTYSSLSKELDKTPFERGLKQVLHKKKIPLDDLVKALENHIPALDFICFKLFLLTHARTWAELGFTTRYFSGDPIAANRSHGSQFLFSFNLDPCRASSLIASPKALNVDNIILSLALILSSPFDASEELRLSLGSKQEHLLHPFFATFDLEEFDWSFLNSFLENFTKKNQKKTT